MEETVFPDERLELIFTCCHPSLALESQVALTLRALGGLRTEEIARTFLVPEETMKRRYRGEAQDQGCGHRPTEPSSLAGAMTSNST
jgi:predicted RNA polymerase sigma factor